MAKIIHAKPSLYSYYFEIIKEIGNKYGYNIVLHGSMNRDLDLIAIPWIDDVKDKEEMIDEIAKTIGGILLIQNRTIENPNGNRFGIRSHGRMTYIININRDIEYKYDGIQSNIKEYSTPQYYIDISIMPILKTEENEK